MFFGNACDPVLRPSIQYKRAQESISRERARLFNWEVYMLPPETRLKCNKKNFSVSVSTLLHQTIRGREGAKGGLVFFASFFLPLSVSCCFAPCMHVKFGQRNGLKRHPCYIYTGTSKYLCLYPTLVPRCYAYLLFVSDSKLFVPKSLAQF